MNIFFLPIIYFSFPSADVISSTNLIISILLFLPSSLYSFLLYLYIPTILPYSSFCSSLLSHFYHISSTVIMSVSFSFHFTSLSSSSYNFLQYSNLISFNISFSSFSATLSGARKCCKGFREYFLTNFCNSFAKLLHRERQIRSWELE